MRKIKKKSNLVSMNEQAQAPKKKDPRPHLLNDDYEDDDDDDEGPSFERGLDVPLPPLGRERLRKKALQSICCCFFVVYIRILCIYITNFVAARNLVSLHTYTQTEDWMLHP